MQTLLSAVTKPCVNDRRVNHLTRGKRVSLLRQREIWTYVKLHATMVVHIFEIVGCTKGSLQSVLFPETFDREKIV